MKKIVLIYNSWEEYSVAYKKYESRGFEVAVVAGIENAISLNASEIDYIAIVKA